MPPKRSEKSRRNVKSLVLIFNLIGKSLLFLTRVWEAHSLGPWHIWYTFGRSCSLSQARAFQEGGWRGWPFWSSEAVGPPRLPPRSPGCGHKMSYPAAFLYELTWLFVCVGLLGRWTNVQCLGSAGPAPQPGSTKLSLPLATWTPPSSARECTSAALAAGGFCGPCYLGSRRVQGETWSRSPLPSLPSCHVQGNFLLRSKCFRATSGQERHGLVRTRAVIHRQECESWPNPVVNRDELNAL